MFGNAENGDWEKGRREGRREGEKLDGKRVLGILEEARARARRARRVSTGRAILCNDDNDRMNGGERRKKIRKSWLSPLLYAYS